MLCAHVCVCKPFCEIKPFCCVLVCVVVVWPCVLEKKITCQRGSALPSQVAECPVEFRESGAEPSTVRSFALSCAQLSRYSMHALFPCQACVHARWVAHIPFLSALCLVIRDDNCTGLCVCPFAQHTLHMYYVRFSYWPVPSFNILAAQTPQTSELASLTRRCVCLARAISAAATLVHTGHGTYVCWCWLVKGTVPLEKRISR